MNPVDELKRSGSKKAEFEKLYSFLPRELTEELDRLSDSLGGVVASEIRLRANGLCWAVVSGRNLPLLYRIDGEEMEWLVRKLCGGSVHAHTETASKGFISIGGGIRVGVGGEARYEDGKLVGIGEPSSLCFRIPTGKCEFAEDVYSCYMEKGMPCTLIISPPAEGKTTLLRALGGLIGTDRNPRRVVIVDERREFIKEDYREGLVDILSGYRRDEGIEIALRTMSPEVIIVDELGSVRDAEALLNAYGAGVSVIASCHGRSIDELRCRPGLSSLLEIGAFGLFIRLHTSQGRFGYTVIEK